MTQFKKVSETKCNHQDFAWLLYGLEYHDEAGLWCEVATETYHAAHEPSRMRYVEPLAIVHGYEEAKRQCDAFIGHDGRFYYLTVKAGSLREFKREITDFKDFIDSLDVTPTPFIAAQECKHSPSVQWEGL